LDLILTGLGQVLHHAHFRPPGLPGKHLKFVNKGADQEQAAAGLVSYRDLKEACTEAVIALLTPLQDRYATFAADPQTMTHVLRDGAAQARSLAEPTLARAKAAIGQLPP